MRFALVVVAFDMNPSSLLRIPLAAAYVLGAGGGARDDGRARILMLHGTPRRRAGALERLLRYVKRFFEVVPLERLARDAARGDVRLRRQLAITFDDGLRNNVEVAYPILRRLGLRATFFVCPQLVEERAWLWNHEARARLRFLRRPEDWVEGMKLLPIEERRLEEAKLREAARAWRPTDEERHACDLAGWDELRALDPRVVTIGSHTLTHPILTSLDEAALEREIGESRRVLEAKLGRPVETFAYPNGGFDARVLACARRHYAAAVTVERGFVREGSDPLRLPRVSLPWSALRLALALHREPQDYLRVAPMTTSGSQVAT
jgi:peptidoglycan/xylan/chitin deacetylase (PgdA/CDA1 family)